MTAACDYFYNLAVSFNSPVLQCANNYGCSINTCETACNNNTLAVPIFSGSLMGAEDISSLLTDYAVSYSGFNGVCQAVTCIELCSAGPTAAPTTAQPTPPTTIAPAVPTASANCATSNQLNGIIANCASSVTLAPTSRTPAPTTLFASYGAACTYWYNYALLLNDPVLQCAYSQGCSILACDMACTNNSLLVPAVGGSSLMGATSLNAAINTYAAATSGLTGSCPTVTCSAACGAPTTAPTPPTVPAPTTTSKPTNLPTVSPTAHCPNGFYASAVYCLQQTPMGATTGLTSAQVCGVMTQHLLNAATVCAIGRLGCTYQQCVDTCNTFGPYEAQDNTTYAVGLDSVLAVNGFIPMCSVDTLPASCDIVCSGTQPPTPPKTLAPVTARPVAPPVTAAPTSSTPTSRPTAVGATAAPTPPPTNRPTAVAPVVNTALWSAQFSSIALTFSTNTNMAGVTGPVACSKLMTFPGDACVDVTSTLASLTAVPQLTAPNCSHVCVWTTPSTLQILFSGATQMSKTGNIGVGLGSPALVIKQANGASLAVAQTIAAAVSGADPAPVLTVTAPLQLSICSPPLSLLAAVSSGMAGRTSGSVQWYRDSTLVSDSSAVGSIAPYLKYTEASSPLSATTHAYYAAVTNWLGDTTQSQPFTVTWINDASISVTIAGGSAITTPLGGGVSLTASVSVPQACLVASGFSGSTVPFVYQWFIYNNADATATPLSFTAGQAYGLNFPTITIAPGALLPGTYSFTIVASVSNLASFTGYSITQVTVPTAPLVAIVAGSQTLQVLTTDTVTLDGSLSCDPNVPVPKCSTLTGLLSGSNNVNHDWSCADYLGNPVALANAMNAKLVIPAGTFTKAGSPYTCVDFVSPRAVTTAETASALTPTVTITVRDPPPCPAAALSLYNVPAQMPPVSSVTLRATNYTALSGASLQWSVASLNNQPLASIMASVSVASTLPWIFIDASTMIPQVQYTFTLTATTRCTGGSASTSSASMTFAVNTGPTGGALSVSPSSGVSTTPFELSASAFSDDTDALPLQYSFLIDQGAGTFSSLSAYSFDPTLSAYLAPNADGSPVKITVVAKNAYGVTTVKGAVYATVAVTNPVVALTSSDVSLQLANLANGGASTQSTAQLVAVLAASVATSADAGDAQAAQASLLDTLQSANNAAAATATPQELSGQVSSLLVLLQSASTTNNTDPQFLASAGDLVSSLLTQSLASISAQVQGANDPLAQALIPPGLVTSSLSSLESYLQAALAALTSLVRRRQLSSTNDQTTYNTLISSLAALTGIELTGAISGSPAVYHTQDSYSTAMLRTSPSDVGVILTSFQITTGGGASSITVTLPVQMFAGDSVSSTADILGVYFNTNLHELSQPANAAVIVDSFVTLNVYRTGESAPFAVTNLATPVNITFPLAFNKAPSAVKTLACGWWDTVAQSWSTAGCTVGSVAAPTSASDTSGSVTCQCTHASATTADVAYWDVAVPSTQSPTSAVNLVPTTHSAASALPVTVVALVVAIVVVAAVA